MLYLGTQCCKWGNDKTTQATSPFTTSDVMWQTVPHPSHFLRQWFPVSLRPGVCLIRIWLLFLLAEIEHRWLPAPKIPYLGFWLWSCAYFNPPKEWILGTVVTKQSKIDNINLYNHVQGRKGRIPLKWDICPQNVIMFGVQIAFYLIFILVQGNEKRPWLINAFNMFIFFL